MVAVLPSESGFMTLGSPNVTIPGAAFVLESIGATGELLLWPDTSVSPEVEATGGIIAGRSSRDPCTVVAVVVSPGYHEFPEGGQLLHAQIGLV